jgi:DNA-binding Lrp family transcriptional regulator
MNNKTRDLLFLSSENSRIKIKDISQSLNMSSQLAKYQLKKLINDKLIYEPYCIFDYSYFGFILFKVYFKGGYVGEKDKAKIIKELSSNEYIISIYELIGEFDLAIEILAPNPSRFNKVIKAITNESKTLKHYKIVLNIVSHIYQKNYLTKNKNIKDLNEKDIIIGGDRNLQKFTPNEIELVKILLKTPLARYSSTAKSSKINVKTINNLWKKLEEKNIIRGFKYILNIDNLDIYHSRLFLKLHNFDNEKEFELMEYLKNTSEITSAHKTLGDWDFEIDIESFDKTQIRKITIMLREKFSEIIETFNIMEFFHFYKRRYLPKKME